MSAEYSRVKEQVRAIESARPAADVDPEGHKEANERITQLIDRSRLFAEAERSRKVPL
ncbi:hypothetical protein [Sinorhizobium fredii]|uniref:hypothetical protein n=1 Tax=Rhizobium fredii TaxID=380 RepID=UPI0004B881D6|nr:hypothetical protein [Sinorhizobium fredii]